MATFASTRIYSKLFKNFAKTGLERKERKIFIKSLKRETSIVSEFIKDTVATKSYVRNIIYCNITFGSRRKKREKHFPPTISRSTGRSTYAFVSWLRGVSMERGNKEKFVTESLMPAG